MKRLQIILMFALIICAQNVSLAHDRAIESKQLPSKAINFINNYFSGEKIALAKIDKEIFHTTYEVVLTNSIKIEFFKNGDWKNVDCRYSQVPVDIVPQQIINKVKELYPDNYIIEIDKESNEYEAKLNNKMELKFDSRFNLIDIDN